MIQSRGYAISHKTAPLAPYTFERRDPGPTDVVLDIQYAGICHSDIHQVRDEWGNAIYPMVPGHEIVGVITKVGSAVTKFKEGDLAGVGVMVDSCRVCAPCKSGEEQFCHKGAIMTYNVLDYAGDITYGGYANNIVTDEAFVLKVSPSLDLPGVAPLLCAGITTYSPLRHAKVGKGSKVGVVGLGGLGHMGLKFAHSFGAHVVQFTTSLSKKEDALRLGADEVVLLKDADALAAHASSFDFILDTVSAQHDIDQLLNLLTLDGRLTMVGLPEKPLTLSAFSLPANRRSLSGSMIGGIRETQEMLDYCAEHNIVSDIELIQPDYINEAYDRVVKSDVKYRFVIDATRF